MSKRTYLERIRAGEMAAVIEEWSTGSSLGTAAVAADAVYEMMRDGEEELALELVQSLDRAFATASLSAYGGRRN